jgi:hypothetical protein
MLGDIRGYPSKIKYKIMNCFNTFEAYQTQPNMKENLVFCYNCSLVKYLNPSLIHGIYNQYFVYNFAQMRIFQNSCQVVQKLHGIIKHWEKNLSVFRGHITKSTRCLFQEHLTLKVLPLNPLPNLSPPSPISMKAISIYNFF